MSSILVRAPFDLRPLGEVPLTSAAECEQRMERAYRAHHSGDIMPIYQRVEILERVRQGIIERRETIALSIAREGGKPLRDALVEVDRAADGIRVAIAYAQTITGRQIPMGLTAATSGRLAFTVREPAGVVLAISAFNHPFNLVVHQVIPAILAGCPVLLKPSSKTPQVARILFELLYEAGISSDQAALLLPDRSCLKSLVSDPRVGFFSFIGSAEVGFSLRSQLAPGVPCALEHGGLAPVVIDETADLREAARLLTKGAFYHAGQVCVSVQRVFVLGRHSEELVHHLAELAGQLSVGDPELPGTDVGPLIDPAEVDRVETWVKEALGEGAILRAGGERISATTFTPTILENPSDGSRVMRSEVFGPVVCIRSVADLDEAIQRANQGRSCFQAAVMTRDFDRALYAARRLKGTAIVINDHSAFRADWAPFGGRYESGVSLGGMEASLHDLMPEKMIVVRTAMSGS